MCHGTLLNRIQINNIWRDIISELTCLYLLDQLNSPGLGNIYSPGLGKNIIINSSLGLGSGSHAPLYTNWLRRWLGKEKRFNALLLACLVPAALAY